MPVIAAVGSEVTADAATGGTAALTAATSTDVAASSAAFVAGTAAPGAVSIAGAGSSIFTIGNAAAAAGVLGSAVSAYGQHQAGVATSNADKQKARVEALSAGQQQINMRQKLLASLASQNAGSLGAGVNKAGAMRQITQNQNDLMANQANESAQVSLLDQGASNAMGAGNLGAAGAGLGGLAGAAKNFNFGGS